ncbi:hypothetical protein T484DRAFT_3356753 [Baffinella frigidus]|nr:hypothetical protein T484DRAFT_3356753 [Cryptophyta sp. CCMP2293]
MPAPASLWRGAETAKAAPSASLSMLPSPKGVSVSCECSATALNASLSKLPNDTGVSGVSVVWQYRRVSVTYREILPNDTDSTLECTLGAVQECAGQLRSMSSQLPPAPASRCCPRTRVSVFRRCAPMSSHLRSTPASRCCPTPRVSVSVAEHSRCCPQERACESSATALNANLSMRPKDSCVSVPQLHSTSSAGAPRDYRGTSLIRKRTPPRTTIGPWA